MILFTKCRNSALVQNSKCKLPIKPQKTITRSLLLFIIPLALLIPVALYAHSNPHHDTISIEVESHLNFPDTESASSSQEIVVQPTDGGAAVFSATGRRNKSVYVRVLENKVRLYNQAGKRLYVDTFTYGGSLIPHRKGAVARFDMRGDLNNIRIGATANLRNKQENGTYSGNITLKIIYK